MRTPARYGKTPQKTLGSLVVVIGAVVGGVFGSEIGRSAVRSFFGGGASIDAKLAATASQINATLPMMVDQNTRLDTTIAMPGQKFCYVYTIVNMDPMPASDDIEAIMRPLLLNNYRTAPEMQELRDANVTLVYKYRDEQGRQLSTFEIAVADL